MQVIRRLETELDGEDLDSDEGRAIIEDLIDDYNALLSKEHDQAARLDIENQSLKEKFSYLSRGIGRPLQKDFETYVQWSDEHEVDSPMDYLMWLENKVLDAK